MNWQKEVPAYPSAIHKRKRAVLMRRPLSMSALMERGVYRRMDMEAIRNSELLGTPIPTSRLVASSASE